MKREELLQKIKHVQALAERGAGGERDNARWWMNCRPW